MITWADLFEEDGSPLRRSYKQLRPAITTRTAGVLDQAASEDWFNRDAQWEPEKGRGIARLLLRLPGCGAAVLAEIDSIRRGRDRQEERGSLVRNVTALLDEKEIRRVEAYRLATAPDELRADTLRRLIIAGLDRS